MTTSRADANSGPSASAREVLTEPSPDEEARLEERLAAMNEALVEAKKTAVLAIATERRMRAQGEAETDTARAAEYRLEWERQKAASDALLDAVRGLQSDIERTQHQKAIARVRAMRARSEEEIALALGEIESVCRAQLAAVEARLSGDASARQGPGRTRVRGLRDEAEQTWTIALAEQGLIEGRCDEEKRSAGEWYAKATMAIGAGEDDLAAEALRRRRDHLVSAEALGERLEGHRRLVAALRELKDGAGALERASEILEGVESTR